MGLIELLKERQTKSGDFGRQLRGLVRAEISKFKDEIEQELRAMLEDRIGEEGITTIKGDRGHTPTRGVDYLTPNEVSQLKKELKGKNGKTPTTNELLSLIQPLIPEVKDGKDADEMAIREALMEEIEEMLTKQNTEFDKKLRDIQRAKREKGGGGGLSLPVSQTFSGDGATTSFTLNSKVAAGGAAIWVYYNGQYLVPTTHFTITNNAANATIALTFTPDDGTSIDTLRLRA